ncbi:MAG: HAD-IB family phosphatase, partial [Pseudomonadota bacterium]
EEALTTRVAMLKGLPLQAVKDCFETRIHLNRGATTLVATMAAEGARCLLVSGGFTAFTEQVANAAGFHGHSANTLIDDGASLTGKVQLPILGRAAKLDRLNQAVADLNIELRDTLAIGDGANDLAMIEAAGLGLAYRAKPIVAEKAHASIAYTDLTSALFFQGYHEDEFVTS